ncbi:hypothetical protein [Actinoplanes sp. NPDC049316]|uniref:hypothetical protein n=1 Tax=Actinoplanes sp. NPDC049316 TaxID=3154727 RepID=UPI00341BC036
MRRLPLTGEHSGQLFALAQQLLPALKGKSVGGGSDGNFTGDEGRGGRLATRP